MYKLVGRNKWSALRRMERCNAFHLLHPTTHFGSVFARLGAIPGNGSLNDKGAHAGRWCVVLRTPVPALLLETAVAPAALMHQHRPCV